MIKLVSLALILSLFLNPVGFALAHPLKVKGRTDLPAASEGEGNEEEDPTGGDTRVAIAPDPDAIPAPTLSLLKTFLGLSGALLPGHEDEILGKLTASFQSGHNRDWLRLNRVLAYLIAHIEARRGLNWEQAHVTYRYEEAKLYVGYPVAACAGLIILPFLASCIVSTLAYAGRQAGSTFTYACTRLGECFAARRARQRISGLKERAARDLIQIETALQLSGFARYCKAAIEKTQ